jgi:hypothetical protein
MKSQEAPLQMQGEESMPIDQSANQVADVKQDFNEELYNNPTVEEIASHLGDFEYGVPTNDGVLREKRPFVYFENGSRYSGEWSVNANQRDG